MRFTLEQVNTIHDRLGSAATLIRYTEELGILGVEHADSYVADGHSVFFGANGFSVISPAAHETFVVADVGNKEGLVHHLKLHDLGKTTYAEMSKGLAESGVEKWIIDTQALTMTFYDKAGNKLLVDDIK